MNQTATTFLDELQARLDATPVEACTFVLNDEIKPDETALGDMTPLAMRLYEIAKHYEREQKKVKATMLRIQAAALEADTEKQVKQEVKSLEKLHALLGMKSSLALDLMWIELRALFNDHLPEGKDVIGLRKGNIVVARKSAASFPLPFFGLEKE